MDTKKENILSNKHIHPAPMLHVYHHQIAMDNIDTVKMLNSLPLANTSKLI